MAPNTEHKSSERILAEEVQDAAQTEEPHLAQPIETRSTGFMATLWSNRLLIAITLALVVVVGAVASMAIGNWWFLIAALLVHAVGTVLVVGFVLQLSTQVEHPAPETVAALEERGVRDPEQALNEQVAATEQEGETEEQRDRLTPSRQSRAVR
jgi:fatty acid desaturase